MNIFKELNLSQLVANFFLATFLFVTVTFNSGDIFSTNLPSGNYLAAANQSKTTYPTDDSKVDGLLYSDSKAESLNNDFISSKAKKELLDPTQIPAKKQPIIDRSNPDNKLLERTQQMFEDAGNFSAN